MRRSRKMWTAAALLALVPLLAACNDDKGTGIQEETDMEAAVTLWNRIVTEQYTDASAEWSLFPGKTGIYPPDTTLMGNDPHMGPRLFRTYVNASARTALLEESFPLPDDAILVKESFDADTNMTAITVMRKRSGYDPDNADWYWAMYMPGGNNGVTDMAGKIQMCIQCHAGASSSDRVWTRIE